VYKRGPKGRTFHRFQNPLLQPFAILYGLQRGLISEEQIVARPQRHGEPEAHSDEGTGEE
jgi:hypothetical protein